MKNFITSYKWINLPVVLCSTAIVSSAAFAVPSTSQQYQDAQQTNRLSQQYVGGNTQIGAGITDQGNVDVEINQVLSEGQNHSTSGGLWADYDLKGDDKGFQGRGIEVNHNWVTRDDSGRALRVNKAKAAYDRNGSGHDKVTLGYGQETNNLFWDGRVSKGLSGRKNTRDTNSGKISDRGYEYGVGASVGKFIPDSNLRVRGGLDHEWSSKVGNNEDDATNTTLSAGIEKFFDGTGHSVSVDVSGSKRGGGYNDGNSSDNDYSARLGYKYDFAGSNAFQNTKTSKRIRVEVPGNAVAPRYEARTQYKKVPTFKTVPVYGKKMVKVPYKRMVKSTMALEGQTFFKKNSSKLIPSAQLRLTEVANQIKKSGYKGSIRITGNTCGLGNARYDQILSEKRAKSVRNFLIKKGFNPDHLMARGLGKDHPKFRNIPGEGFKNRRVDIEYVTETTVAKTAYRNQEKTVQTGTRKVATGFKNVAAGTKNVLIDNGRAGTPRVIWKTETVNNAPAWIKRGLHNNIKHDRSINTYQTTEGFDTQPINTAPIAKDDNVKTACGIPLTIDVLGNDTDLDNNPLSILKYTQGANGTVSKDANGQLIYISNDSGCGLDDKFTYTVSDGNGGTDTATVTVTVEPDKTVSAVNETITAEAGQALTIDVLSNDDADANIKRIVKAPDNGTASIVNGKVVYKANTNFSGTDTFTYEVEDANGNLDIATVTINVAGSQVITPVNNPPVANNDQASTTIGEEVILDSLANDTDADDDTLIIESVSNPANGSAVISGGQIKYTPDSGFEGTDTFTYIISDGNGGTDEAMETVIVTAPSSQAPIATNDDAGTVVCSGPVTINVLENDNDADSETLNILNFTQPTNGTVTKNANGELIYTSNGNSCGTNDQFTYTITDGVNNSNPATVTVAIAPKVNTSPEAVDDTVTTQVDTPIIIMSVANDTDLDGDSLVITNVSKPAKGTTVISADGKKITYSPDAGFTGVDVFDYTISDGNGGTAMATETVTVTATPNTKPKAVDDSTTTQEGTPVTLMTVANDSDPENDNLTITNVDKPANGTAVVSADGKKITYSPDAGFIGDDVFDYTITDGNGGTAMATETVTVTAAPNKKPTAVDDSITTQEGTPVTLMTVANDSDPENDNLTITNVDKPANGTAVVSADGKKITYSPDAGFIGDDVFDYTITDGNGGTAMATETVTVTAAPNKKPTAVDDSASTFETTAVTLMTVTNDSDPDGDNLLITNVNNPANGTAVISSDGKKITYTPDSGFVGEDSFDYTISDGKGGTATATETVTVKSLDDKIGTGTDRVTIDKDTSVDINVLLNDSGKGLIITAVDTPPNGNATINNGVITYTPNPGFVGQDEFFYDITDQTGETDSAMVIVTVIEPVTKN